MSKAVEQLCDKYALILKEVLVKHAQIAYELDALLVELGYDAQRSASLVRGRRL